MLLILMRYLYSGSFNARPALRHLSLIPALKVYLTDFLKCTFPGELNKNRAFLGQVKIEGRRCLPSGH
jgi:hypothetical protein